jgi:hypothetical protein
MTYLKKLIQQLIPTQEAKSKTEEEVLVREPIEHSRVFLEDYKKWKAAKMHKGLLAHLFENATVKAMNPDADVNYFAYRDDQSNGFYFHSESPWNQTDYAFFVEHLVELLKDEGYVLKHSRREVVEGEKLKTTEQFYLKPAMKYRMEKAYQQLFGNIIIEHRLIDNQTNLVKLMAQIYQGRVYQKPDSFEHLMDLIFQS